MFQEEICLLGTFCFLFWKAEVTLLLMSLSNVTNTTRYIVREPRISSDKVDSIVGYGKVISL